MANILEKEISSLEKKISTISMKVEENMNNAVNALIKNDTNIAKQVIKDDDAIDNLEIEVEEQCLKILALHQPVAVDLRYIISVLKINNDLERIGDLAGNIADVVIYLGEEKKSEVPPTIPQMAEIVSEMLKQSLDALFKKDINKAIYIQKRDDDVDALHSKMYKYIEDNISNNKNSYMHDIRFLSVSRYLERIADHCTNIAEDVEYYIKGKITRHHFDD